MKKYKLYYATEENCFEGEKIGEFKTLQEAISCMRENMKDDMDEKDIPTFEYIQFEKQLNVDICENANGYNVIYIITTDGRKARSTIAEMRREIIGENF